MGSSAIQCWPDKEGFKSGSCYYPGRAVCHYVTAGSCQRTNSLTKPAREIPQPKSYLNLSTSPIPPDRANKSTRLTIMGYKRTRDVLPQPSTEKNARENQHMGINRSYQMSESRNASPSIIESDQTSTTTAQTPIQRPRGPVGARRQSSPNNDTILAVDMKENLSLGYAVFSGGDNCLSVGQDIAMADPDVLQHLLVYSQPTAVLISARLSERTNRSIERLPEFIGRSMKSEGIISQFAG